MAVLYDCFSDKLHIPVPKPIPLYLSIEDLDMKSHPELFFNFSFYGYCIWIKKHYSKYVLYLRGFQGNSFDGNVRYYNPHSVTKMTFNDFDSCVSYFRLYCFDLVDFCLNGTLPIPVNNPNYLSDFKKRQRSRIVSRIFRLEQKLLPLRAQKELFDVY